MSGAKYLHDDDNNNNNTENAEILVDTEVHL